MTLRALTRPRWPQPMPEHHPKTAHLLPYLVGDARSAPSAAHRAGYRYIDMNGNADKWGWTWLIHYDEYRKQYPYICIGVDANGREKRIEVPDDWPLYVHQLPPSQVRMLRSALVGGHKPITAKAGMIECVRHGMILCLEVKGSPGYLGLRAWAILRLWAIQTRAVVIIMTLQNLYRRGHPEDPWTRLSWAGRMKFARAILPRGPEPDEWPAYREAGIKKWGEWR
ncbi:MAG: hypothetical protein J7518_17945 [Nocardioidaceae bacterium]|nr:hypothetical protein [Nocardioidaceae bacterium]